ncbi:MAG: acetylglutamate kinase [Fimbriimonadaceae bacterium]|nr:acetylglutamate kinase [Fimbriimonadaceae bacterium]
MSSHAVAAVLNQALPYIQRFQGQTFVVKYGGSALQHPESVRAAVRNVLLLQLVGIRVVLVHGGGPEIDALLQRLNIPKVTRDGLRVTDDDTMAAVEMALLRANQALVAEILRAGGQAVGLSGRDGGLLRAAPMRDDLGRVGRVDAVHSGPIEAVLGSGAVPVICSVAAGPDFSALNVNADTAAAAVAGALRAEKLILMTDTNGVLASADDPESTLSTLPTDLARAMIADGRASRGMIPKLQAALDALGQGVKAVHLINAGVENALLVEVFTDAGIGTMLRS